MIGARLARTSWSRARPARYTVARDAGRWRIVSHGVKVGDFDDEAAAVALAEKLAREAAHLGRWARVAVVREGGWSECRLIFRRDLDLDHGGHALFTRVRRFRVSAAAEPPSGPSGHLPQGGRIERGLDAPPLGELSRSD